LRNRGCNEKGVKDAEKESRADLRPLSKKVLQFLHERPLLLSARTKALSHVKKQTIGGEHEVRVGMKVYVATRILKYL
jgi:hypothetical protein